MRQLAALPDDQPSSSVDFSDSCDNAGDQGVRVPPSIFCTKSAPADDDHPFTPTSGATSALYGSGTRSSLAPDDAFRDPTPSPSGSGGGGKLRTPSQSSCLSTSPATTPTQRSPKRVSFLVSEAEKDDKAERRPLKETGHPLSGYGDAGGITRNKSDYVKSEACCCAMM